MKIKKRIVTLLGVIVVGLFVFALAALAAGGYGSSSDPLISLSYLTDVFTPEMDGLIAEKVDGKAAELTASLDTRLSALEQRVKTAEQAVVSGDYAQAALGAGQTLRLRAGTELLLRSGAASCSAALTDLSLAAELAAGEALAGNHLYVAVGDDCTVTASADALLLLRGAWTLG